MATGETRHQSNRGGGWRRVRTRRHRRRMIKKYANPHIVYFNSIIILENIIIPSTSLFDGENGGAEFWEGKNYGLTVTVSLSPGGRCVRGANHIKIGCLLERPPGFRGHGDSQTVFFFLPKLRPAVFTIKKFCATTLSFTSVSPLNNQYPRQPIIVP